MFGEAHLYPGVALAGLVSFLSPCVLPLVPPYLVFLGGTSLEEMLDDEVESHVWRRIVLASLFFVLGFTTVFVGLGASASALGQFIQSYRNELGMVAGLIIILFGLHFLGVLRFDFLHREVRYHHAHNAGTSYAGAYLIGLAFAFGWTPCIGPILATVLALAANEASLGAGVRLLTVYSLGLGVPFVLAAVAIRPFLAFMQHFRPYLGRVEKVMGALLVVTGILFLTGSITWFGQWLIETFPGLARIEELVTPAGLEERLRQHVPDSSGPPSP